MTQWLTWANGAHALGLVVLAAKAVLTLLLLKLHAHANSVGLPRGRTTPAAPRNGYKSFGWA